MNSRNLLFGFIGIVLCLQTNFAQSVLEINTRLETETALLIREATVFLPLTLTEKSAYKVKKEPIYQSKKPIYGKVSIGNSPNKQNILIVIDEANGKVPRLYVDANNNRNLTDDGNPELMKDASDRFFRDVIIKATFISGKKSEEINLPYSIFRFRNEESEQTRIVLQSKFARSGELKIGNNTYKILAQTFNQQALFSNTEEITLGIDTDQDGQINKSLLSAEIFWGGNFGGKPFNIAGETYRIARASESGDKIILEVSPTKVAANKYISINSPAPEFGFQTLDGKFVTLPDLKGKVVLLDFWAVWCAPCVANLPDIKTIYNQHQRSEFEIVGISLDGGESKTTVDDLQNFIAKEQLKWLLTFDNGGWNNAIAKMYNVTGIPIHIVIDKKGVIRFIGRSGGKEKINQIGKLVDDLIKE